MGLHPLHPLLHVYTRKFLVFTSKSCITHDFGILRINSYSTPSPLLERSIYVRIYSDPPLENRGSAPVYHHKRLPYMGKFGVGKKLTNLVNRRPFANFLSANVSF